MRRNIPASEAAEQLGCSLDTVQRLIARGRLVAYRYSEGTGPLWVCQKSIDAFLDSVRVKAEG